MPALWDTTLVCSVQPDSEKLDFVLDQMAARTPVRVAAPAISEVVYGYQRKADDNRFQQLLDWFTRLVASEAFDVVPLDGRAAVVAGRMRAEAPHAPGASKGDRRSKTMRQASWLLDIQIAATAFAAGLDVATVNRRDFEQLAELLTTLFPEAPPLAVTER